MKFDDQVRRLSARNCLCLSIHIQRALIDYDLQPCGRRRGDHSHPHLGLVPAGHSPFRRANRPQRRQQATVRDSRIFDGDILGSAGQGAAFHLDPHGTLDKLRRRFPALFSPGRVLNDVVNRCFMERHPMPGALTARVLTYSTIAVPNHFFFEGIEKTMRIERIESDFRIHLSQQERMPNADDISSFAA